MVIFVLFCLRYGRDLVMTQALLQNRRFSHFNPSCQYSEQDPQPGFWIFSEADVFLGRWQGMRLP